MSEVFDLVKEECHIAMLIREMDISGLMKNVKQLMKEKLKKRKVGQSKRAYYEGGF